MAKKDPSTSWESAEPWYNRCVGEKGHYYHQSVILPSILRLLDINDKSKGSFLDLGCGQGVLERLLPPQIDYWGIDISSSLIADAKKQTKKQNRHFLVGDACEPLSLQKSDFDWASFILCLQNMAEGKAAIANAGRHLKKGGRLLIVLNHPTFRIPRQSAWGIDEKAKIQYRRLNTYMSPLKIPIQMNPGKGDESVTTYSFHHPLTDYMSWLSQAGFMIEKLEEWCSDKKSEGGKAKMEDRARKEFPLFLALVCFKSS